MNTQRGNRPPASVLEDKSITQTGKPFDQQGLGHNGWDCGPIAISNINDYVNKPDKTNQQFTSQIILYTMGLSNETMHEDKVVSRRVEDCVTYKNNNTSMPRESLVSYRKEQEQLSQNLIRETKEKIGNRPGWQQRLSRLQSNENIALFYTILNSLKTNNRTLSISEFSEEMLVQTYDTTLEIIGKKIPLPEAKLKQAEAVQEAQSTTGSVSTVSLFAPTGMATRSRAKQQHLELSPRL